MRYTRQDVVFAPDPFRAESNPRPWLIISDEQMPFPGDLLCVVCTRSEYDFNHEVRDEHFETGEMADETTYCSPWLLATLKPASISFKVGTVTEEFTKMIAEDATQYIDRG